MNALSKMLGAACPVRDSMHGALSLMLGCAFEGRDVLLRT